MNEMDIVEMIKSKSASPLGLDRAGVQEANILRGANADAFPGYTRGRVTNIIAENAQADLREAFLETFNREFGTSYTDADIPSLLDKVHPIERSENVRAALDITLENIGIQSSLKDEGKPLGTFINRQGIAISTTGQTEDVLKDLARKGVMVPVQTASGTQLIPVSDYVTLKYSVATLPPSDAVDLSKELAVSGKSIDDMRDSMSGRLMKVQEMEQIMREIYQARSSGVTDKVIMDTMINNLFKEFGFENPMDITELMTSLESSGKGSVTVTAEKIGYLQGMQLASGASRNDLVGLDLALLTPQSKARRIYTTDEMLELRDQAVIGLEQAKAHVQRNTWRGSNRR